MQLPRSIRILALTSLFADISTEMLYPVLPVFLTKDLGASASVVGVIEGIAQGTQNAVQGGSGWLADRFRRNKPLALFGYALAALAKPFMGLAGTWPEVLAARFADRLGTGIRSAPRDALIASSAPVARRGAAFGLEGAGDNLGAVIGPLLTAALLFTMRPNLRVFFLLALLPGLIAVLLMTSIPERSTPKKAKRVDLGGLPTTYWRYLLATGIFGLGNLSSAFVILKATAAGLATEQTVVVYAGYNLVAALISYPAGRLSDTLGRRTLLLSTFMLLAAVSAGLAIANTAIFIIPLFILYGAYQGGFRALGKSFAIDLVPDQLHASAVGLYGTTLGLAALLASVIGGQLWDRLGSVGTFTYGAAFAVAGTIALAWLVPSGRGRHIL